MKFQELAVLLPELVLAVQVEATEGQAGEVPLVDWVERWATV